MNRIEQLKADLAAVTPGRWEPRDNTSAIEYSGWELANVDTIPPSTFAIALPEHYARLIANLHNAAPALIEAVEALQRIIEEGDPSAVTDGYDALAKLKGETK